MKTLMKRFLTTNSLKTLLPFALFILAGISGYVSFLVLFSDSDFIYKSLALVIIILILMAFDKAARSY